MLKPRLLYITGLFWCGLLALTISSCRPDAPGLTSTPGTAPSPSPSSFTPEIPPQASPSPTSTSMPLAARVDGIEITLAEFQSALAMHRAAKGTELAPEEQQQTLDDLIDQALLAKAAQENGFVVDEALLQERMQQLIEQAGGDQSLKSWLSTYQYDETTFRRALQLAIGAAWMRDKIAGETPTSAEQIHARQILVYDAAVADEIYQQLQAGNSFRNLALKYDPLTGGDLGWFPRGFLPHPQIETAAFGLQADQFSQVIETSAGFHILQVLERAPERFLSPEARLALQIQAVQTWLQAQRSQVEIQVFLP